MKKWFRLALRVLLLLSLIGTVAGCTWICTPPPGTDTGDIGWKLGLVFAPFFAGILLVWELSFYGCVMYFLADREKWNIPLTIFMALLTLGVLGFLFYVFGDYLLYFFSC